VSGYAIRLRPGRSRLAYPTLLAVGAVDAAGYGVIAPVLPELESATGAGAAELGLLVATFSLAMLLGFPVAGLLVGRGRARLALVLSLVVVALGTLGMIAGESLASFFAARAVMGFGAGGVWLGVVFSTLERWPGEEYVCMSRIFSAYSVGGLLGLVLGALGGVRAPFVAYLCLVVLAIPAALLLSEPARRTRLGAGAGAGRSALRRPGFVLAASVILFTWVGFGVLEGVLPLLFDRRLGQAGIAAILVATALVVALSSALAARFGPTRVAAVAVPLVVAGFGLAGAVESVVLWAAALAAVGVGLGACNTGSTGILLEGVGRSRIVVPLVVWSQVGIAGYLLGPALGGLVADGVGYAAVFLVPLAFAGVVAVVALGVRRVGTQHPRVDAQ
jgi:MFS family permease